jgi:hypothetical protein
VRGIPLAVAAVLALAGTACGRSAPAPAPSAWNQPWSAAKAGHPDWVRDPTANGRYIATYGSALRGDSSLSAQRDEAVAAARRELARMVYVKVQSAFSSYVAESGVGDEAEARRLVQDVSRQISVVGVRSTVVREQWIDPRTDELFVWVAIEPGLAERFAAEVGKTAKVQAARDPKLAHLDAKLAADRAFIDLDRTLDQHFKKKE